MVKMVLGGGSLMILLFKKLPSFLFRILASSIGRFFVYFILRYVVIAHDKATPLANISLLIFASTNLCQYLTTMIAIPEMAMKRTRRIRGMIFI
jgi:hypothetical protein